MLEIDVKIIQHSEQRYDTVGDWWFSAWTMFGKPVIETLHIRVSKMNNEAYEFLVARHEIDEAFLCRARGISEKAVTDFDIAFELTRTPANEAEPGDSAAAPYHREHVFATAQERIMATELGVNWEHYSNAVESLVWEPKPSFESKIGGDKLSSRVSPFRR